MLAALSFGSEGCQQQCPQAHWSNVPGEESTPQEWVTTPRHAFHKYLGFELFTSHLWQWLNHSCPRRTCRSTRPVSQPMCSLLQPSESWASVSTTSQHMQEPRFISHRMPCGSIPKACNFYDHSFYYPTAEKWEKSTLHYGQGGTVTWWVPILHSGYGTQVEKAIGDWQCGLPWSGTDTRNDPHDTGKACSLHTAYLTTMSLNSTLGCPLGTSTGSQC